MTSTRTPRILLAEDEEAMRTYLERALTNAGYEVSAVDRGTDAVPLLETGDYDLLLSDIVMPEMDGYTAVRKLRQQGYSGIIAALTASAATNDVPKAMEAGCDYFISKPVGNDFESEIAEILKKRKRN